MEISYVVLFGNFFYHSYIAGGGKKFQREKQLKTGANGTAVNGEHKTNGALKSE